MGWARFYCPVLPMSRVRAAVGVSTACASLHFIWFNAGGFFVKGPVGLYLAGGYFKIRAVGGACLASVGAGGAAGVAAAAFVYYMPWEAIWDFLKKVLAATRILRLPIENKKKKITRYSKSVKT